MNSILFIYIFSLFVVTSPNFIFKTPIKNHLVVAIIHAAVFSCILYFTYDIVNRNVIESAVVTNDTKQQDEHVHTIDIGTAAADGDKTIIIESSGSNLEGIKKNATNIAKLEQQQQHNQTIYADANDVVRLAKTSADNAAIYAQTAYQAAGQMNGASTAAPATHTTSGAATHTTSGAATHTTSGSTPPAAPPAAPTAAPPAAPVVSPPAAPPTPLISFQLFKGSVNNKEYMVIDPTSTSTTVGSKTLTTYAITYSSTQSDGTYFTLKQFLKGDNTPYGNISIVPINNQNIFLGIANTNKTLYAAEQNAISNELFSIGNKQWAQQAFTGMYWYLDGNPGKENFGVPLKEGCECFRRRPSINNIWTQIYFTNIAITNPTEDMKNLYQNNCWGYAPAT